MPNRSSGLDDLLLVVGSFKEGVYQAYAFKTMEK
tara:strand:+ start:294 stop:395 length:102 start_codon:yes stop_codon:yes gene_type:complete